MKFQATTDANSDTPPQTTAKAILLVEDEPIVRDVTREVLEHAGYRVLESSGPEEAIRLAGEHAGQIGLLLTDVVMPGMNGADLAVRLQSKQPDLIAIFMSGYAESDVLRKVREGHAIHIQKPFTVDSLLSRIAEALEAKVLPDDPKTLTGFSA
jgi:two-component system cell cycle sensor histidine kinase/response regulator CckA